MKTEDLQAKGLSQEQIAFVMAENGKDVNAIKAERDGYKTQLDTAQASLKAMEGIDAAGLQTKVTELTSQLQGKDDEIEKIKADYAFDACRFPEVCQSFLICLGFQTVIMLLLSYLLFFFVSLLPHLPPPAFFGLVIGMNEYHWSGSVRTIIDDLQFSDVVKILCCIKIYC